MLTGASLALPQPQSQSAPLTEEEPVDETNELLYFMGGIEPIMRDSGEVKLSGTPLNIKEQLAVWDNDKDEGDEETTDITISPQQINEITTNAQETINPGIFDITVADFGVESARPVGAGRRHGALFGAPEPGSNSNATQSENEIIFDSAPEPGSNSNATESENEIIYDSAFEKRQAARAVEAAEAAEAAQSENEIIYDSAFEKRQAARAAGKRTRNKNDDEGAVSSKMPRLDVDIGDLYNEVEGIVDVSLNSFKEQNKPQQGNTVDSVFGRWMKFLEFEL